MTANIEFQINLFDDDATWCWCWWSEERGKLIVITEYLCEQEEAKKLQCDFVILLQIKFLCLKCWKVRENSPSVMNFQTYKYQLKCLIVVDYNESKKAITVWMYKAEIINQSSCEEKENFQPRLSSIFRCDMRSYAICNSIGKRQQLVVKQIDITERMSDSCHSQFTMHTQVDVKGKSRRRHVKFFHKSCSH